MAENDQQEQVNDRLRRLESILTWLLLDGPPATSAVRELWLAEIARGDLKMSKSAWEAHYNAIERAQTKEAKERADVQMRMDRLTSSSDHSTQMFKTVDDTLMSLDRRIARQSTKIAALQRDMHSWLAMLSLGADIAEVPLTRFLPVRLYVADADFSELSGAKAHFEALLNAIGLEIADELPIEYGSIFRKFWSNTKEVCTQPEVANRLEKLERAVQLQGIEKPQAEVDAIYFNAASEFLKANEPIPTVAAQIGPLLVLKAPGPSGPQVQVKKLTTDQLIALEKNQGWLSSPADILKKLDTACQPAFYNDTEALAGMLRFKGGPETDGIASRSKIARPKKKKKNDDEEDDPPLALPPPA